MFKETALKQDIDTSINLYFYESVRLGLIFVLFLDLILPFFKTLKNLKTLTFNMFRRIILQVFRLVPLPPPLLPVDEGSFILRKTVTFQVLNLLRLFKSTRWINSKTQKLSS